MGNWDKGTRLACAVAVAATLALACLVPARAALASEEADAEVAETSQSYEEARAQLEEVEARIEENERRVDELEAEIPEQQEAAAAAISSHYKLQQDSPGLVMLLLSADDFDDFVTTLGYLEVVSARNSEEIEELLGMQEELEATRAELDEDRAEAEERVAEAEAALAAAQAAAQAQAEAEAEEAAAAIAAAQEAANTQATSESGNSFTVEIPSASSPSAVEWPADKTAFVALWAPRIDAYLAGSPLSGHGSTFAEAAYDYGVDPRWSPAIACIESGKGAYCFLPCNAWGWGAVSWPDWDTAIRAHVAGLASGYGYTISVAAAQKYCPPNWEFWYSSVLSEMERI